MPEEDQLVIEGEVTPDMQEIIDQMKEDGAEEAPQTEEAQATEEPQEAPAEEETEEAEESSGSIFGDLPDNRPEFFESEEFNKLVDATGMEPDAIGEEIVKSMSFPVRIKGETVKVPYSQFINHFRRDVTSQQMYDRVIGSQEYKMGLLVKAAEDGDKGAQKELLNTLVKMTSAQDADDLLDQMDSVDDEVDKDKLFDTAMADEDLERVFGDVKNNVDFEANLTRVKSEVAEFMPKDLFDEAWSTDAERRAMYDLVSSGAFDHIAPRFQELMSRLPAEERKEIEGDLELYGKALIEVMEIVKEENGLSAGTEQPDGAPENQPKRSAKAKKSPTPTSRGLSAVSRGTRNKGAKKGGDEEIDWLNMPDEEFEARQAELRKAGRIATD